MSVDLHKSFRLGAEALVHANYRYTELHRSNGISSEEWAVLTQPEHWTPEQARDARGLIANCIEVAMTISGLPATPLPGQYAAAVIAIVVAPANRMIAALKAPETFDAVAAAGITETFQVKPMAKEQMMALVMAYSGGYGGEPPMQRLPADVVELVKTANSKGDK